jgi:perosamine synthetase
VIPIYKPWVGEQEAEAARRPILSGWLTQGPEVAAFEREFADYLGCPQAVAVANCTVALQLGLQLLGVQCGDEVLTVSHSYIATANSIRYLGARPVFVDIQPETYNLNPELLEAAYTPRCKALMVVHQIGMPADLGRILEWARGKGLPVIEDAACALGSEILRDGEWQKIGRPHGDMAAFSFHPRKLLTTGDGGMLTMHNPEWAERARRLRQHSMSLSDLARHGSSQVTFESYPEVGYNFRMTDVQAAIGRVQLQKLPALLERRRAQVQWYKDRLALDWQRQPDWARSNWQSLGFRLPPGRPQAEVMQQLLEAGVSTRRGIMCAHREAAYPAGSWAGGPLPESERTQDEVLLLPLFHDLTEVDMEKVAAAVERFA